VQLADVPGWVWQLAGASGGVFIGFVVAAFRRDRRERNRPRVTQAAASQQDLEAVASQLHSLPASGPDSTQLHSHLPSAPESPQERLMARLTKANKDLEAQVRAAAASHSRLVKSKDDAIAAAQSDCEMRLEELRQAHSGELKYLMNLLLKEVERITKLREDYLASMESELGRLRGETVRQTFAEYEATQISRLDPATRTSYVQTEVMDLDHRTR